MRATAKAGRFGLLLALLLVLLGVGATAGPTGEGRASGIWESTSTAPTMHDDIQHRVRLFTVARQAQATPQPDTWWAVRPRAIGGSAPRGSSSIGDAGGTGMATAMSTPRSSRAPPLLTD